MRLTNEQLESYTRDGFLLLTEYFSPAEIEILLAETSLRFSEDTPRRILEKSGAVRSVFGTHQTSEVFRCLSRLARLVEPAREILNSEVYIHQFKINAKVALEGDQWEWHQDFLYWHKEDAMPEPNVLTAAVFLQEMNDFNGPILVIPGIHREGMIDIKAVEKTLPDNNGGHENGDNEKPWLSTLTADLKYKIDKKILAQLMSKSRIAAVKGPAGSVLLFHGNLFHASSSNISPWDRICVFITYNSVENKLAAIENPRPDFIASRDFSPIVPVPDDALLMTRTHK